jgi:hypothetical protein
MEETLQETFLSAPAVRSVLEHGGYRDGSSCIEVAPNA